MRRTKKIVSSFAHGIIILFFGIDKTFLFFGF